VNQWYTNVQVIHTNYGPGIVNLVCTIWTPSESVAEQNSCSVSV